MPRQPRAEQTRAAIIRAAAEMFDRYGYGSTGLSDVVAHAGVTKGALYFHFRSKQDLAQAVVQEQHALWAAEATTVAGLETPALEALIRMSYRLAWQLRVDPVVRGGIRLTLEHTFDRPLPDPYLDWIAMTTQILRRAEAEADIRTTMDLERIARFLVSSFTGLHVVAQVIDFRQHLVDQVGDLWRLVLPGLVPSRKLTYYLGFVVAAGRETVAVVPGQQVTATEPRTAIRPS
ncbi:ScbR family autoregulator-binding transcription factor [Micromonospora echinofusca]|uniref:TetR family transcriptional regulator n=1 Tax=Micromonospora echinofusca TaxID=47858 RepID=A0ABS3VTH0_MICEH|nr:ScbR family autoregulator-binding transcription factor [Micromonospora echinofusca]MBO4207820.1 TetR family transcriptional regulator [Micromonospora echinofusca]